MNKILWIKIIQKKSNVASAKKHSNDDIVMMTRRILC